MNNFLIILNILLATGVAASLGSNIKRLKDSGEQITVPKRQPKVQVKSDAAAVQTKAMTDEEKATAILEGDIFNPDRSPLLNSGGGGRSEMTLAGTYKVGDVQGAIVIVRNRQRQFNPFMPQFAFGPGMGGMGGPGGMNMRLANGQLGSMRQRFVQRNQQNQLSAGNRQSVKVGESLPNGYTLISVGRASATLARGSDRVELVLQDPSKVKGSRSSGARPRANAQQQFMQAHMATQQMMLRTMQSMQRSMNGGGGFGGRGFGGGGGGGRGGRR